MINIRPVSDLRNKFPEIEELVLKEDEAVYLTKNGYGSMVLLSIEKYVKMLDEYNLEQDMLERFGTDDIEKALLASEKEANNPNTKWRSSDDLDKAIKGVLKKWKSIK